ncbi:MAG TPA: hypothetical protein VFW98_04945 [Gemmatimonadaceae bacterium]|nr:hypothetical protein [Gemmatimonadaceae bacterium]
MSITALGELALAGELGVRWTQTSERMKRSAIPWRGRFAAWPIVLGIAAIVGIVLVVEFVLAADPGTQPEAAECRAAYERARTAVDSAAVDAQRPLVRRQSAAPSRLSCGELRRSGELR